MQTARPPLSQAFCVITIAYRLSQPRLHCDSMHDLGYVSCVHGNVCSLSDKAGAHDVVQSSGCIRQSYDMLLVAVKESQLQACSQECCCEGMMLRQACGVQPHLRASTI